MITPNGPIRTFNMDFRQQMLVPLNVVAFSRSHRWKIQFNKVRNHMASVTESPIQCIKTTTQINDLTFVASSLQKHCRKYNIHISSSLQKPFKPLAN